MIWLVLACGEDPEATGGGVDGARLIADYDGLTDENTWVYRDDGDTGLFDDRELLRTRHTGDGVVEFRRGLRWADAESVGTMTWGQSEGLSLSSWSLFGAGSGDYRLCDADPADGETVGEGSWSCALSIPAEGETTWYGTFEDTVVIDCTGEALAGRYTFARNVGLVRLLLEDGGGLNLVAPW